MTDEIKTELAHYRADAAAKLAALPARRKAEAEAAALERRRPFPITPLTEVQPHVLAQALSAIKDTPADMEETVGTLRRVCHEHPHVPFGMRCDQLLRVLDLAGLTANA